MKWMYRVSPAVLVAWLLILMALVAPSPGSAATDPVFVGAGDIANCDPNGAEATARLLDGIAGTVFTTGDNAYSDGSPEQFQRCYEPTWGRHKARTRPSPGNHDYHTNNAAPYYAYFGDNAGPAGRGYYSFTLGAWHIVSLNSEVAADATSAQARWLAADLAANPATCIVAYWHKPVFSSGSHHGNDPHMKPIWGILARAGADVVLTGHDHEYERFAPQTSDGKADPNGIREFVVGTGGASHYGFGRIQPNSEVRNANTFGVLKLTLHPTSYDWEFVPVSGGTFRDTGSAACVGGGPEPTSPPPPTAPPTQRPTRTPPTAPPTPQPTRTPLPTECASGAISHVDASGDDGHAPANVLDNNLTTRWSNAGQGSWIAADLGAPHAVCSVGIGWYQGDERTNHFVVQASDDGTAYTDLLHADSSGATTEIEPYSVPLTPARYIRVVVNGNTENDWASITELRINVLGAGTPEPTPLLSPLVVFASAPHDEGG